MSEDSKDSLSLAGSSAWVIVEGRRARVYGATTDGKTAKGYIEAVEGAQYIVVIREEGDKPAVGFDNSLWIDGIWRNAIVTVRSDGHWTLPSWHPGRETWFSGQWVSKTKQCFFFFEAIALDADDSDPEAATPDSPNAKLGTIKIEVRRILKYRSDKKSTWKSSSAASQSGKGVRASSDSKKHKSHQTSLGPAQRTGDAGSAITSTIIEEDENEPWRTFGFRYLSRRLLVLKGLIPDDIKPVVKAEEEPTSKFPKDEEADDVKPPSDTLAGRIKTRAAETDVKPTLPLPKSKSRKRGAFLLLEDGRLEPIPSDRATSASGSVPRSIKDDKCKVIVISDDEEDEVAVSQKSSFKKQKRVDSSETARRRSRSLTMTSELGE